VWRLRKLRRYRVVVGLQELALQLTFAVSLLMLLCIRADSQRSPFGYALCVKDLAKWPKWGSFERPRFCIVDFTEHRAE